MPNGHPPPRGDAPPPGPPPRRPEGLPRAVSDVERAAVAIANGLHGLGKSVAEVEAAAERDRAIGRFFNALTELAGSAKLLLDVAVHDAQQGQQ